MLVLDPSVVSIPLFTGCLLSQDTVSNWMLLFADYLLLPMIIQIPWLTNEWAEGVTTSLAVQQFNFSLIGQSNFKCFIGSVIPKQEKLGVV